MTRYIAAYDTEGVNCPLACRRITELHRQYEMPGTFFVVGQLAEQNAAEMRSLLIDPLFEIASHSWSHIVLLEHPFNTAPLPTREQVTDEIVKGKKSIEDVFEQPCTGFRTPWGFEKGLVGQPWILDLIARTGFKYVSSQLWGVDYSLPVPPRLQAFTYSDDGFPDLWELPGHGWHENLLKSTCGWPPKRFLLWPPEIPESIPPRRVETPEEEVAVNRTILENAVAIGADYVSLIWHPHSMHAFDPEMKMLEGMFQVVQELGLEPCTYADVYQSLATNALRG